LLLEASRHQLFEMHRDATAADSGRDFDRDAGRQTWSRRPAWQPNETDSPIPRRIHIVGWAGSGKTHLARRLAQLIGAPVHELDLVAYGPTVRPDDGRRNLEERLEMVDAITATPRWVTEGIYLWWIDDLLEKADLVVWLDLPRRTASRRILTRHLVASMRRRNRHKGLRLLWRFWWAARAYYTGKRPRPTDPTSDGSITRVMTIEQLTKADDRLVVCRDRRHVDSLVAAFRSPHRTRNDQPWL
jgi:adenylate kinase family enzyme